MNNDLESMIKASEDNLNNELTLVEESLTELPHLRLEYAEVHDSIIKRATEMVSTIAIKYHDINNTYISDKIELDSALFSSTLFQLRTSEFAIKTIIEDMNTGNNTSSIFSSLDRMQRVNTEIVKNMQEQIIIIEQKYRVLQTLDGDVYQHEGPKEGMTGMINDGEFISTNTRDLLQHLTGLSSSDDAHIDRQFIVIPDANEKVNKKHE